MCPLTFFLSSHISWDALVCPSPASGWVDRILPTPTPHHPAPGIQWEREVACGGLTDWLSGLEISSRGADGHYPSHQKACKVLAKSKCICSTSSKGQPMSELLRCWIDPQCPSAPPLGTHVAECPSLLLTGARSSAQMFSMALAMARVLERVTRSPDIQTLVPQFPSL